MADQGVWPPICPTWPGHSVSSQRSHRMGEVQYLPAKGVIFAVRRFTLNPPNTVMCDRVRFIFEFRYSNEKVHCPDAIGIRSVVDSQCAGEDLTTSTFKQSFEHEICTTAYASIPYVARTEKASCNTSLFERLLDHGRVHTNCTTCRINVCRRFRPRCDCLRSGSSREDTSSTQNR